MKNASYAVCNVWDCLMNVLFCVLLFNGWVLYVSMKWLLVNCELQYNTCFTARAIGQTDGSMKCKCKCNVMFIFVVTEMHKSEYMKESALS
jgi:hypothetical protein